MGIRKGCRYSGCLAILGLATAGHGQSLPTTSVAPPSPPLATAPVTAGQAAGVPVPETTADSIKSPPRAASTIAAGSIVRPAPVTSPVRSVADDPRPAWDPKGILLGTMVVHPSLAIEALGKTNVRATEQDRKSDLAAVMTAAMTAETDWGRHALAAEGYYRRTQWVSLGKESRSEFGAVVQGRYDVSSVSNISAIGQYDRLTQAREDINAPDNARRPAQIDRLRGNLSYQMDNGLTLIDADVTVDRRVYRNTEAFNGGRIDQHGRDFTRYQGSLRLGYAVSGSASLIVAATLNRRDYDQLTNGISRNSHGGAVEAGLLFRPSSLLSAEIRAGYLFQNFKAAQLNDAHGLSATAQIVWNALPRTSFRLEASRRVSESSSTVVQSQITTSGTFGVDREILSNLIATAEASYERTNYIGIDRRATLYSVGLKGRYLMSRLTTVTFSLEHVRRTATLSTDRFSGQQARIGISFTI